LSCGKHHDTPCTEVIESVWVYLDGEIDEAQCAQIKLHLDECSPCLQQFGIEEEVKALVHRSCGSDHAPSDLKDRIRVKLTEVRIDADSIETTTVEFRSE
jgi:mycothiol system anti-sigma-R factor